MSELDPNRPRFIQCAVMVPNVDQAAATLNELFGLHLHVFDVEGMGIRVALGDDGLELVQAPAPLAEGLDRLAGIHLNVPDFDATVAKLKKAGYTPKHMVVTPGNLRECSFDIGGIPIVILHVDQSRGFVSNAYGDLPLDQPYKVQIVPGQEV